jgi:hypothetical protein
VKAIGPRLHSLAAAVTAQEEAAASEKPTRQELAATYGFLAAAEIAFAALQYTAGADDGGTSENTCIITHHIKKKSRVRQQ